MNRVSGASQRMGLARNNDENTTDLQSWWSWLWVTSNWTIGLRKGGGLVVMWWLCVEFSFTFLGFLLTSFLLLYRDLVLGLVERFLESRLLHSSGISLGMPVGCICQELWRPFVSVLLHTGPLGFDVVDTCITGVSTVWYIKIDTFQSNHILDHLTSGWTIATLQPRKSVFAVLAQSQLFT